MSAYCRLLTPLHDRSKKVFHLVRNVSSVTGNVKTDNKVDKAIPSRINLLLTYYEDAVGLTEVRDAQSKVIQAETKFMDMQAERRGGQDELARVQTHLRSITMERERTSRVDENYLELVTKEHTALREEKSVSISIGAIEKVERECFTNLSAALRESHEKERARTERMKYWSIIGSFLGVSVGVIGSTLNKHFQMRELRHIVHDTHANSEEYRSGMMKLVEVTNKQHRNIENFMNEVREVYGFESDDGVQNQSTAITSGYNATLTDIYTEIQRSNALIESEIVDIKTLIRSKSPPSDAGRGGLGHGGRLKYDERTMEDGNLVSKHDVDAKLDNDVVEKLASEMTSLKLAEVQTSEENIDVSPSVIHRGEYYEMSLKGVVKAIALVVGLGLACFISNLK